MFFEKKVGKLINFFCGRICGLGLRTPTY